MGSFFFSEKTVSEKPGVKKNKGREIDKDKLNNSQIDRYRGEERERHKDRYRE